MLRGCVAMTAVFDQDGSTRYECIPGSSRLLDAQTHSYPLMFNGNRAADEEVSEGVCVSQQDVRCS